MQSRFFFIIRDFKFFKEKVIEVFSEEGQRKTIKISYSLFDFVFSNLLFRFFSLGTLRKFFELQSFFSGVDFPANVEFISSCLKLRNVIFSVNLLLVQFRKEEAATNKDNVSYFEFLGSFYAVILEESDLKIVEFEAFPMLFFFPQLFLLLLLL